MIFQIAKKFFGTKQDRDLKFLKPIIDKINSFSPMLEKMSDEELQAQTDKFKKLLSENKATLDDLLPEAFATIREASGRVLKMRHFDVQLIGGITLYQGKIAEMKTGEGKTLTATLPLYLAALTGKGAHLVTVNDYLASRDGTEMGELFSWMGLTTGIIVNDMEDEERKEAYNCDITYGTNNEFAFDYLRDNMKFDLKDYVQRDHHFCIVDEVDSILIDEARTPLLISGPSEGSTELYKTSNEVVGHLDKETDYKVDEKSRTAVLTDEGIVKVQKLLKLDNIYETKHVELIHHINQSLKAHTLFQLDVDYVVKDGQVIIVDEFTGRLKTGSRWSDGLHQAVEAKEGVRVKSENQTLASITFQNFFRLYDKLSGMTGTADTEAEEFNKIYGLDVVVIPTNLPMVRIDEADVIYKSKDAKYKAVAKMIGELHAKGQPILVGTISIDSSERLSKILTQNKVPHEVLNAKQHEREAMIIQNAGQKGSVTIATNMAGRGTDIKLTEETKKLGGLCIICTERHESRRIDNQLRGRSGRQGDPGRSKFFLSLEDDLLRIFGSDRIKTMMNRLGMEEDEPIEHKMITNAIAKAQKKVEAHNFDMRKHLLDYDNVMNEQRKIIYTLRKEILSAEENMLLSEQMIEDVAQFIEDTNKPANSKAPVDTWPWEDVNLSFQTIFHSKIELKASTCEQQYQSSVSLYLYETAKAILKEKFAKYGDEQVRMAMREVLLSNLDHFWKDHLLSMDHLKEGINLKAYAQQDPLSAYKREAFGLFEEMKFNAKKAIVSNIFGVELYTPEEIEELKKKQEEYLQAQLAAHQQAAEAKQAAKQVTRSPSKVGRNDPCPCGSGKKFKHCHG